MTQRQQIGYSFIPRRFAKSPAQHGLTISETAVLLGILAAARKQDHRERFAISFKSGAKAMAEQKLYQRTKAFAKEQASIAAANGFHLKMQRLQKLRPPEIIRVDPTRTELLRLSGSSTDTRSLTKLDFVIIQIAHVDRRRPAITVKPLCSISSGRLRLHVASVWIEPSYVKNLWLPLPTRSLTAVNLSLFLRTTNRDGVISLAALCRHIGIDPALPSFSQRRSVRRALNAVNHALIVRWPEPSREPEHRKVPWFYKMMIKTGDRIRFRVRTLYRRTLMTPSQNQCAPAFALRNLHNGSPCLLSWLSMDGPCLLS